MLSADYFDGRTSRRHSVTADVRDGMLHVAGEATFAVPLDAARLRPRVGRAPVRIELPDGGLLVGALAEIAAALPRPRENLPDRLERHPVVVLVALIGLPILIVLAFRTAIPWLARQASRRMPVAVEARIGAESLGILDQYVFHASIVASERQAVLRTGFDALGRNPNVSAALEFRDGGALGANAFALPGGTIIVTDQLANLLSDDQVLAVLAHELGHVEHHHGMQAFSEHSLIAILITIVSGDASGATLAAATAPAVLAQTKYSRDHEREADAFAITLLRRAGRSPADLGAALRTLEHAAGVDVVAAGSPSPGPRGSWMWRALGYLSTHPVTEDRIRAAEDATT